MLVGIFVVSFKDHPSRDLDFHLEQGFLWVLF